MPSRRTQFAYDTAIRAVPTTNIALALLRIAAAVVIAAAWYRDGVPWPWWILILLATVGLYQTIGSARAETTGKEPREPVLRWGWRSSVDAKETYLPNVPGLFEGFAALGFALSVPLAVDTRAGLTLALLGAVLWGTSAFAAVAIDPPFYNPDLPDSGVLELIRVCLGPMLVVIAIGLVAAAKAPQSWTHIGVCLVGFAATVVVWSRDALLREGTTVQHLHGVVALRSVVLPLHGAVASPISMIRDTSSDPVTRDKAGALYLAVHEFMAALQRGEQPRVGLNSVELGLSWLSNGRAILSPSIDELQEPDVDRCRLILNDLISNAVKSGAKAIGVDVKRQSGFILVTIDDDGAPLDHEAWCAPDTSSARLRQALREDDGDLTARQGIQGKMITASWRELQPRFVPD